MRNIFTVNRLLAHAGTLTKKIEIMKTNTKLTKKVQKKKNGFTLIEVIAVLVLLGILAAVAIPRYVDMSEAARDRAIDAAISELNGRESLTWGAQQLQAGGYVDDAAVFAAVDPVLGSEYTFAPTASGGDLTFQGVTVTLVRNPSTATTTAEWTR